MSAKARGERCHSKPVQLRRALPPRDCTSWAREDKLYNPYSKAELPETSSKPAKSTPPRLWLPKRRTDLVLKSSSDSKISDSKASDGKASDGKTGDAKAGRSKSGDGKSSDGKAGDRKARDGKSKDGKAADGKGGESKDGKAKAATVASTTSGGGSVKKPSPRTAMATRPEWDTEHHIMFSRLNHEVQVGVREYFDAPKMKENQGVPRCREAYVMNDRQCGWNDEPDAPGEMRRTLFNSIGPFNLGGCKQQQLPSYWRKVKNWHAYSSPDLKTEWGLSGSRSPLAGERSLLAALADAPASQSTEFWRGWAAAQLKPGSLPEEDARRRWDGRFGETWSKGNEFMNIRQREYFSVPAGKPGRATDGPKSGHDGRDPYLSNSKRAKS